MKQSRFILGLAAIGGLAASGMGLVFAQRGDRSLVPPPPVPVVLPVRGVVVPEPPGGSANANTAGDPLQKSYPPATARPNLAGAVELPPLPQASIVVPPPPKEIMPPRPSGPVSSVPPPPAPIVPAATLVPPAGLHPAIVPIKAPTAGNTVPQVMPGSMESPVRVAVASSGLEGSAGRQEPAVSLEWSGPAVARLNQATTYRLTAKNISTAPVYNVAVRCDTTPSIRVVATDPQATAEANILAWNLGTLAPGQEKRITLQVLPQDKTAIACQASVTFTGAALLTVQVREPKLILKASGPQQVAQGDTATVSINVSNPGDGAAERVKVAAVLPEGLEHVRGKTFELELGTLAAGESRAVQLVCLARSAGPQVVDCAALGDAGLTAQEAFQVEVVAPRLELAVAGPKLRYLERPATYLVKVANAGTAAAGNVSVTHELPQGFKFVAASHGGRHDAASSAVWWFIGDLGPGESREVMVEAVPQAVGEHLHRTATTAARGLRTMAETNTRVEGLSALLMELVDTEDPVEVGKDTSYEIRVTNTGSKTETNLELVCTIPDKMEFRGATCPAGCNFRVQGRDVIFEPLARLDPRADVVYRLVIRGLAPGDMRFRARIRADGLSEPVLREESTRVFGEEVMGKSKTN